MSKTLFETLRELENDDLRFAEIEHGPLDLRVEATSYLMKGDDIDVRVREKMSGFGLVLENLRLEKSQDPPPVFRHDDPYWEYELKAWKATPRPTYFTFLYDIAGVMPTAWGPSDEVPDKHVGESPWVPPTLAADTLALLNEHRKFEGEFIALPGQGQDSCPDCKDGFYIPFVGPKETCRTCEGTMKVATTEKPPTLRPSTGDDLKDDFGQYVSDNIGFIDLNPFKVEPYTDFIWSEERCLRYVIGDQDLDPAIKWDGPEFGRRFCEAVRVDILRLLPLTGVMGVKLHYDHSTLKIGRNELWRAYEMFISYHMRVIQ